MPAGTERHFYIYLLKVFTARLAALALTTLEIIQGT